ncbi:MAG TPA: hypothetical protein VMB79_14440 [Jatrophihabitans sp.]|nr:hypothetical protein [Jatrophihabitans sp.]
MDAGALLRADEADRVVQALSNKAFEQQQTHSLPEPLENHLGQALDALPEVVSEALEIRRRRSASSVSQGNGLSTYGEQGYPVDASRRMTRL